MSKIRSRRHGRNNDGIYKVVMVTCEIAVQDSGTTVEACPQGPWPFPIRLARI